MSMDMDQVQRRDIDTALERVSLGIDEENVTSSPYLFNPIVFNGNNWFFDEIGDFVKLGLAEDDSISFPVTPITNLLYKNITGVTVSFDYEVSTKCVLRNVGLVCAGQTLYESVETVLNGQGHIDVDCSLFGFESSIVNTAITEQGFSIVLNFDGVKSNATVILRDVTFALSFTNDLMSESDAVVNRVNFQTDFYNDDESVVLKVGEVEYPIKLADLFGSAFYDYNLYTNNYNPKIDTTILVTCQVKNILGNPVANKELVLYYKGVAQDPVTTNANGIAEWEINVGNTGGTFKISVNNRYIFINVGGFKLVKSHGGNYYHLYINEFTKTARLRVYFDGTKNIATGHQYIASGFIEEPYKPPYNVITTITRGGTLLGYVLPNGEVGVTNNSGSTMNKPDFSSIIQWSYD